MENSISDNMKVKLLFLVKVINCKGVHFIGKVTVRMQFKVK